MSGAGRRRTVRAPRGALLGVAWGALLAAAGPPAPAAGQEAPEEPLEIPRVRGEVALDGFSDEAAWAGIQPLPMTTFTPTFGAEPTERTEIRVAYDDENLYVGARLYDSDPEDIRANTMYRDRYSGDDVVAVILDSYDDHDTALWFVTNPTGARTDRALSNDAEFVSGDPMNPDWNAHWDVAVERSEEGWFAEFRIPFSTLGFQERGNEVVMGLIAYRFIARKNERQIFPAIPPDWPLAFAKPSQARRIVLRGVESRAPVYVTPYALGGMDRTPDLRFPPDAPEGKWETEEDGTWEVGLDLKYAPSPNLALDLTVNTDFAQVEADAQQINLTRFPLFFPEKRQFFQERAGVFEFTTGAGSENRLFHSRRIGLDEEGRIVRIYGGARLVGRSGGTDYGVLNMQTGATDATPSENVGVLRLRQRVLNRWSTVGGMLTTRIGEEGDHNVAYGLDALLRPFGDEYVTAKWAQTFDDEAASSAPFESGLALLRWERRDESGLSYTAAFTRAGPEYRPGLGFQLRRDFTWLNGELQHQWFPGASSFLRSLAVRATSGHFYRNADGSAWSRTVRPEVEAELKSGAEITLGLQSSFESVREAFPIGDVAIPPGDYWFHEARVELMLPRGGVYRGELTGSVGSFYDGRRIGLTAAPAWNVSRHLELEAGYEVNRLEFDDRAASTTTHLARLRAHLALDTHLSLSTFAQYNSLADLFSVNARLRYHFSEGTDLWVVYDEGLNTLRDPMDPNVPHLPASAFRALRVKYSHTLEF